MLWNNRWWPVRQRRRRKITGYVAHPTSITVHYADGASLVFTYQRDGIGSVERMKRLAERRKDFARFVDACVARGQGVRVS